MDALTRLRSIAGGLAIGLCVVSRTAHASDLAIDHWRELISEASRTFDVPESWISSVMRAESAGQAILGGRPITSPAGAMGLMQIMPDTWAGLRARYGLGNDPYDPHDNVFAGAAYLRELYQRYGYPNLFAAYNAGPGRLDSYLAGTTRLPNETSDYLAELDVRPTPSVSADNRLFFDLNQTGLQSPAPAVGRLFIALRTATISH
jgi:soluble lytic murein transglycosylase-like protein